VIFTLNLSEQRYAWSQWCAVVWWCPGRLLEYMPPYEIIVLSSAVCWSWLLDIRCLCRRNMMSYSRVQTNVLATFVNTTHMFFCTHTLFAHCLLQCVTAVNINYQRFKFSCGSLWVFRTSELSTPTPLVQRASNNGDSPLYQVHSVVQTAFMKHFPIARFRDVTRWAVTQVGRLVQNTALNAKTEQ